MKPFRTDGARLVSTSAFGEVDWTSQKHKVVVVEPPEQDRRRLRNRTLRLRLEEVARTSSIMCYFRLSSDAFPALKLCIGRPESVISGGL
jgi:hypothetical protein